MVGLQASQDHMCFIFPLQSWAAGQESHALGGNQNQDVGPSRALALKLSTSSLTFCQPQRGVERGDLNKSQRYVAGEEGERTGRRRRETDVQQGKGGKQKRHVGLCLEGQTGVGIPLSSKLPYTFQFLMASCLAEGPWPCVLHHLLRARYTQVSKVHVVTTA